MFWIESLYFACHKSNLPRSHLFRVWGSTGTIPVKLLLSVKSSKHTIKEGQWIHTPHYFNQYTRNKSKQYNHLPKLSFVSFDSCPISSGMVPVKSLFVVKS